MAALYTARDIAVLALRMIGVVAPQDSEASEGKILIALQILDLILAEKAGTTRFWFMTPQNATFNYAANSTSVDLTGLLGSNKLDFVRYAYNDDTSDPITLLRRDEYDLFKQGLFPFITGRALYIATDGDDTYTAYLLPTPTSAVTIRLTGNKFSTSVSAAVRSSSDVPHGFEVAWQRWMVHALAADAGNGPLARIPEERLSRWSRIADNSFAILNSYRGGGQRSQARYTRAWTG